VKPMGSEQPVLAVDLGGTNLRIGLVTGHGEVIARRSTARGDVTTKEALCDGIADHIRAFLGSGKTSAAPVALSVAFAGPTDSRSGCVYFAPNLGGLEDLCLADELQARLGIKSFVANDADCAALGEYWKGAGQGASSLFLFTLGTGMGGAMVIGGELWEGSLGIAGEIGHTVVDLDGPACACGKRGCLEALVSGTAVVREYGQCRGGGAAGASITAEAVFQLARRNDPCALEVVEKTAKVLGVGISNVYLLLNPEIILVGGGIARAGTMLIEPATDHARSLLFPQLRDGLVVKRATLDDDSGIVGAAYLAFQRLSAGW
jgi:glucokinase